MKMEGYKTKARRLSGTRYKEVYDEAFYVYDKIQRQTKRRPYVRSEYFRNEKIFIDTFWRHLHQKNWRDRARRLRFLPAAIEMLKHTRRKPTEKILSSNENGYRFVGYTSDGHAFCVQIKQNMKNKEKSLISAFPLKK